MCVKQCTAVIKCQGLFQRPVLLSVDLHPLAMAFSWREIWVSSTLGKVSIQIISSLGTKCLEFRVALWLAKLIARMCSPLLTLCKFTQLHTRIWLRAYPKHLLWYKISFWSSKRLKLLGIRTLKSLRDTKSSQTEFSRSFNSGRKYKGHFRQNQSLKSLARCRKLSSRTTAN